MKPPVFDPEKLVGFIQELRQLGFVISTEQYAAAQDLLITLVAHGRIPADPQNLSTWLAPVLCTSPEEQQTFHEEFKRWLKSQARQKPEAKEIGVRARADARSEVKDGKRASNRRSQPWLPWAALVLTIVAAAITFDRIQVPRWLTGYVVDKTGNPVNNAAVTLREQKTATDERGRFTLTYNTKDLPGTIIVLHNKYEPSEFEFNTTTELPLSITLKDYTSQGVGPKPTTEPNVDKKAAAKVTDIQPDQPGGMAKFYREHFELIRAATMLLPFLVFGAWWLRRIHNLRRFRLMKRSASDEQSLHYIVVKSAADQLFQGQAFRRVAQELRRHRQYGSNEIDPPRTVSATIRKGGWFTPVYGLRRAQPEYLALIDRASFDDQQAQLENALINRLVKDGVIIERYYFHGSPLVCRTEDAKAPHFDLQELLAQYPKHNLLLFSDGEGLINPFTVEPQRWLDMLTPWSVRALLTPREPNNWSYHEWVLSEQGFVVVPASKEGIGALIETINTGDVPKLGSGKTQPFPEMLQERPWRWLDGHEPERAVVNRLCFQLRRFLGDEGYYLLGACAVYPMLHWKLTLHLAYKLGGSDDPEEKLRSLVRLPWLRHGVMPDWLRRRVISAMPKKHEVLTRQVLKELLLSSLKKTPGSIFNLPYIKGEQTNCDASGRKGLGNGTIKKALAWNHEKLWRNLVRSEPKQSSLRDYVFLTFMSGRKPRRLSLNVPDVLRRALFPQGQVTLGVRPANALLLAMLCAAVAFLASPPNTLEESNSEASRIRLTITGHSNMVTSLAFSPDGKVLAGGSRDNTIALWDASTGGELDMLTGHSGRVTSLAFSPDGKMLADNTITLWDVSTGRGSVVRRGYLGPVDSVAFSPDGKVLASGGRYDTVKLWDVSTGNELDTLMGQSDKVTLLAFPPDGNVLAGDSGHNTIVLWDVGTGNELDTLMGRLRIVYSAAFSPDGKILASSNWDKTIKLWDLSTGEELATLQGHSSLVTSLAFSPDSKVLAGDSRDNTVKLWDVNTGNELATLRGHSKMVTSLAFSPDSKVLASGSRDGVVNLWDVAGILK